MPLTGLVIVAWKRALARDNLHRKIEMRAPRVHLIFAPVAT